MPAVYPLAAALPKNVADLAAFEVRVRCRTCSRISRLDLEHLKLDRRMPLTRFLAKLRYTARPGREKGCGAYADAIEISYEPPRSPYVAHPGRKVWAMDRTGEWSERPRVESDISADQPDRRHAAMDGNPG
jgi:hypothetical protein